MGVSVLSYHPCDTAEALYIACSMRQNPGLIEYCVRVLLILMLMLMLMLMYEQVCQSGRSKCSKARHDASSRGLMSFFVSGTDAIVHSGGEC